METVVSSTKDLEYFIKLKENETYEKTLSMKNRV